MVGIGGGGIVHEGLMVGDVVLADAAVGGGVGLAAVGETAFKPAPRDTLLVEQVADVFAGEADLVGTAAVVVERVGIADEGPFNNVAGDVADGGNDAVGLAGDKIDGAWRGGTEGGVERVVAHGEVLGVVPESGDGVAVKVVDHLAQGAAGAGG